jgi:O-acetyl-ADP-ribose deacetylase (regulator of RNase III)
MKIAAEKRKSGASAPCPTGEAVLTDCPGIKRVVFVCFDGENYDLYKKALG